ncbi:MAG: hydrogenase 3 maturation endopeptidase HyCI [Gemmatimonadota bacterium]
MRRDLTELLAARLGGETVVVGIGNPHRGDDAAGCLVARCLRESAGAAARSSLRIVEAEEVPESFLGPILRPPPNAVVLVDAVELGEPPGTVALLEVEEVEDREASTHRAPLSLLAGYIRAETGADVFVLGIQPGGRELGTPPSDEVRKTAGILADVLEAAAILAAFPKPQQEVATC